MWPFTKPKPEPPGVIIRDVLGKQIDHVSGVWHLAGADLRGRNWSHVDLSDRSLDGANCEGMNLFGARLMKTDFFCRRYWRRLQAGRPHRRFDVSNRNTIGETRSGYYFGAVGHTRPQSHRYRASDSVVVCLPHELYVLDSSKPDRLTRLINQSMNGMAA
jgi:hypothetical protein